MLRAHQNEKRSVLKLYEYLFGMLFFQMGR